MKRPIESSQVLTDLDYEEIGRSFFGLLQGELEFAGKGRKRGKGKKECERGLSCGATCISKKKTCVKDMTASQRAKYNALRAKYNALRAKVKAGGGGGEAQQDLQRSAATQATPVSTLPPKVSPQVQQPTSGRAALDTTRLDPAIDKYLESKAAYERYFNEIKSAPMEARPAMVERAKALKLRMLADLRRSTEVMAEYRAQLVSKGLSREKAEAIADRVKMDLPPIQQKAMREIVVEFAQMTNGAIEGKLERMVNVRDRAFAVQEKALVNVGDTKRSDYKRILFHEMAHLLESDSDKKSNNEWIWERSNGRLAKLNDLIEPKDGKPVYGDQEIAVRDRFPRAYTGKYYGDPSKFRTREDGWNSSATEVYSMGLEHFSSPELMVKLYSQDREHFTRMQTLLEVI